MMSNDRSAVRIFTAVSLSTSSCLSAPAVLAEPSPDTGATFENVLVNGVRPLLDDKLSGNVQNVPQSVTVVSKDLIAAQADTRLEDALKNVPGITLNAGEGAARGDTVNLRGFSAFNDFFVDGIRDAAVYSRDSFDLESVEVVKGPSAILFGRGSTGGAINQVSKAPTLTPLDSITADIGTNHEYRATADIDVPFSSNAAFRLNAMGESSDVADRSDVYNKRWGLAPSLALGIGEDDALVMTYLHQQESNRPDAGIPFLDGRPAPVPRDANFGLISDHDSTEDDIATARYKHDFSSTIAIADTLRFAHYLFDYQFTAPNYGDTAPAVGEPPSAISVGHDAPDSSGSQTNFTNQTDFTMRFDTGFISHSLLAGLEVSRQTSDIARYSNPFNNDNTWIPLTSLLDPDPYEPLPGLKAITSQQNTTAHSYSAYLTDTLGFGPYVSFMLGGRFDRFSAEYAQSVAAPLDLEHTDNLGSPRAALIVKPTPTQSYYFSFGTSFDPSAEALALTTKTANLGPVKAKSYEIGAKNDWLDGQFSTTAALFHTEVDNAQTNDPENPTLTVLNGDQRVEGAEFGINGYLTQHWEVFGGYTYLDGRTIASGNAAYIGQQLPNVARHALNLWTEYELTDALEVGTGGNWLGARYADSEQQATIPGYVVWNAMASYKLSRSFFVQLNLINLTNRLYYENSYYTSESENHVIPGAGRTAKLTVRMTF